LINTGFRKTPEWNAMSQKAIDDLDDYAFEKFKPLIKDRLHMLNND